MLRPRSHKRTPTLVAATIIANGGIIDCCVRDLSSGGAKLKVADASLVPKEFQLVLKDTGEVRRAAIKWRRPSEIGVAFMQERRTFGRRSTSLVK